MGISARSFFTEKDKQTIKLAVQQAEKNTSGEIRVHIENHCKGDPVFRAAVVFEKLGMAATKARNGVLFYLAVKDKKFAIIGDEGIDSKVPPGFWEEMKSLMIAHFREGKFCEGLSEGIILAGSELGRFFPYKRDDINELPDDISFD